MEKMNFDELKEFLRTSNCGGFFQVKGEGIEGEAHLPIGLVDILANIPEKGLDYSIIESEGGMMTGEDRNSKYDFKKPEVVNQFLYELMNENFIKRTDSGLYKISKIAKTAEYEYFPVSGW